MICFNLMLRLLGKSASLQCLTEKIWHFKAEFSQKLLIQATEWYFENEAEANGGWGEGAGRPLEDHKLPIRRKFVLI